jgi:ribosomal protein S10
MNFVLKVRFRGIDSRAVDLSVSNFLNLLSSYKSKNIDFSFSTPILIPRKQEKLNAEKTTSKEDFYANKIKFDRALVIKNVEESFFENLKAFEAMAGIGVEIRTSIVL